MNADERREGRAIDTIYMIHTIDTICGKLKESGFIVNRPIRFNRVHRENRVHRV